MSAAPLTAERARALLDYNPTTGALVWKVARQGTGGVGSVAGGLDARGRMQISVDSHKLYASRVVWLIATGEWPVGRVVFRNGNRADLRLHNLRDVPRGGETQNQRRARKDSLTGVLGVTRRGNRYRAQICAEGRRQMLGTFATAGEAHSAYMEAKRRLHVGYVGEGTP